MSIKLELPVLNEGESYTGETLRIPRLEVPSIRVSYKSEDDETKVCPKGEFIQYNPATKEITALGKKITIQILHHRQSLSAYKNEQGYWTPEISMKAKTAPLFVSGKDKNGKRTLQFLAEGTIKKDGDLRTAYPDLRYQRNLYVIHDGQLKTLVIYGASFSGFIDLTKELKGQSSASVILELSTHKEKTGTVIYYPIAFGIKDQIDMKTIEPVLKEFSEWFDKYDSLIAKQQTEKRKQAEIDRGDADPADYSDVEAPAPSQPNQSTATMSEQMKEVKDLEEDGEEKITLDQVPF